MALALLVALAALVVGRLLGGRLGALADASLRLGALLLLAVAVAVGAEVLGLQGPARLTAEAVAAALAVVVLAANARLPGIPLVALGMLANLVVVAANGGAMPVLASAAERAGVDLDRLYAADSGHAVVTPETRLRALGDVVPMPLPGWPQVVSAGDVLVAAGVGLLVVALMRGAAAGRGRGAGGQRLERSERETTFDSDSTTRGSYS